MTTTPFDYTDAELQKAAEAVKKEKNTNNIVWDDIRQHLEKNDSFSGVGAVKRTQEQ